MRRPTFTKSAWLSLVPAKSIPHLFLLPRTGGGSYIRVSFFPPFIFELSSERWIDIVFALLLLPTPRPSKRIDPFPRTKSPLVPFDQCLGNPVSALTFAGPLFFSPQDLGSRAVFSPPPPQFLRLFFCHISFHNLLSKSDRF